MNATQIIITGKNEVSLQSLPLVPAPLEPNEVIVEAECSFISAGTELSISTGTDAGVFTPGSWCAYPWKAGYANVGVVREAALYRSKPCASSPKVAKSSSRGRRALR
jgi:hypothetical protein